MPVRSQAQRVVVILLCALLFVPLLAAVPVYAADTGYYLEGLVASYNNGYLNTYSVDTPLSGSGSSRGYAYRWYVSDGDNNSARIPVSDLSSLIVSFSCIFQGDLSFSEASVNAGARTRSVVYAIGCYDSTDTFLKYVKFRDTDFSVSNHFINVLGSELPSNTAYISVLFGVGIFGNDGWDSPLSSGLTGWTSMLSPGTSFIGSVSVTNGDHSFTSGLYSQSSIKPVQYVWTHDLQDIYLGNSTSFNTCIGIYNTYHEVSNVSFEMFSDPAYDEEYGSYYSQTADFTFNVFRVSAVPLVNSGQSAFCNVRIKVNGSTVWTGSGATVNLGTPSGGGSGGSSEEILEILDDTKEIKDALELVQLQNEQLKISIDDMPDKITDGMQSIIDQENEKSESEGNKFVDQITGLVPNESQGFVDSMGSLVNVLSYDGTECVLTIPALTIPAIEPHFSEFTVLEAQQLDFEEYINMMPPNLLLLIRSLLTGALIVYCFKELYGVISYFFVLKGGET